MVYHLSEQRHKSGTLWKSKTFTIERGINYGKIFCCEGNTVIIGKKEKRFAYLIRDAKLCKDKVIILLDIPFNDNEINNLFAINENCEIVWQAEDLRGVFTNQTLLPYEQMVIVDNEIRVSDFYGRRYYINNDNGKIIKRDITK